MEEAFWDDVSDSMEVVLADLFSLESAMVEEGSLEHVLEEEGSWEDVAGSLEAVPVEVASLLEGAEWRGTSSDTSTISQLLSSYCGVSLQETGHS